MSGLFGGATGKDSPQDVNIPAFTSSGGITPQQQEFANFSAGQGLDANAAQFSSMGALGDSTMATQGAEGVANQQAENLGQMSDADQEAMYTLYGNQVSAEEQGLQNDITLGNQNSASGTSLAALAGSALGGGTTNSTATTS